MKRSRFSEEQIITILREQEAGAKTVEVCRKHGVSDATDVAIRVRLRELAAARRRFGYRRLHILLQREGFTVNHKKLRRLYAEERLQVRRRGGRKRALGTRAPLTLPQGPNQRWSMDFLHDQLSDGRRFRILALDDKRGSGHGRRAKSCLVCYRDPSKTFS